MRKLVRGNCIVKATISYSDNTYAIDRTVYVDEKGEEFIKINGHFTELDFFKKSATFKFHDYWW